MKKVVVVGSINMDLVTLCERAPRGGETLLGKKFMQIPGGKGANQAVAIGKMATNVTLLGKVGHEGMGDILLKAMKADGVNVSNVEYSDDMTGIAKIIVEEGGQNRILVVPGANYSVDNQYIDKHIDVIKNCDILVAQLEIPLETVKYSLKLAKEFGKTTILNPAPAQKLDAEIIANSDYIIPNETELEILSGVKVTDDESVIKAAKVLLNGGVKGLIVTLGKNGSMFINEDSVKSFPAYKVDAIDTTAAGDSFIGGFCSGLAEGLSFEMAIERGTKVAAISVTRIGAQTSIPTLEEVLNFKGE